MEDYVSSKLRIGFLNDKVEEIKVTKRLLNVIFIKNICPMCACLWSWSFLPLAIQPADPLN